MWRCCVGIVAAAKREHRISDVEGPPQSAIRRPAKTLLASLSWPGEPSQNEATGRGPGPADITLDEKDRLVVSLKASGLVRP